MGIAGFIAKFDRYEIKRGSGHFVPQYPMGIAPPSGRNPTGHDLTTCSKKVDEKWIEMIVISIFLKNHPSPVFPAKRYYRLSFPTPRYMKPLSSMSPFWYTLRPSTKTGASMISRTLSRSIVKYSLCFVTITRACTPSSVP